MNAKITIMGFKMFVYSILTLKLQFLWTFFIWVMTMNWGKYKVFAARIYPDLLYFFCTSTSHILHISVLSIWFRIDWILTLFVSSNIFDLTAGVSNPVAAKQKIHHPLTIMTESWDQSMCWYFIKQESFWKNKLKNTLPG